MTRVKAKMGLALLLVTSLAASARALVYPMRTKKQPESKQAAEPKPAKPARAQQTRTDLDGDQIGLLHPLAPHALGLMQLL